MSIEIVEEPIAFDLYGVSGPVENFDFPGAGMKLMEAMNGRIQLAGLEGKGTMFWVYDSTEQMFTGHEFADGDAAAAVLEHKPVALRRYAYQKYVGPYSGLGDVHRELEGVIKALSQTEIGPRVEKYGDWMKDESQLETEIFIGLE